MLLLASYSQAVSLHAKTRDQKNSANTSSNQWRLGLGIGVEFHDLEAKVNDNISTVFTSHEDSTRSRTKKFIHVAPAIELGLSMGRDFYLGMLLAGRYLDKSIKSKAGLEQGWHLSRKFQMDYSFDLLAKPGYELAPNVMIYGLIGPSIAKWSDDTDLLLNGTRTNNLKISETSLGLGVGLGFEYLVQKKYAFSVDYIYHAYKSESGSKQMTIQLQQPIGGLQTITENVSRKIEPSYATVGFRFTYFL